MVNAISTVSVFIEMKGVNIPMRLVCRDSRRDIRGRRAVQTIARAAFLDRA